MLAGTAIIYLCGVSWLSYLGVDSTTALEYGFTPFVIGDTVNLLLAAPLCLSPGIASASPEYAVAG